MKINNMYLNLNTLYTHCSFLTDLNKINNYLDKLINNQTLMNDSNYDLINYEYLIYIYVNYFEHEEILEKINIIFSKISNNYEYKEKLIAQWQNKE